MTNPAVFIVTGVVIAVAAVIAIFASNSERPQAYGRRGPGNGNTNRRPSPPPSPIPAPYQRKREKRRKSPERSSYSPAQESTKNQCKTCHNCGESPYVKVLPCNHESLCKGCFSNYLKTNDTCPACNGRIDSCSPIIPPFGKCKSCRKFTKLFKFLDCGHSLSLCIECFEEQGRSYKECPECQNQIQGCEPTSSTSGICKVCDEFTRFAIFQPCGHGNFCRKHAVQYLRDSEQECMDCGRRVMRVA